MEVKVSFGEEQFSGIFPFYIRINRPLLIESQGKTLEKLYPGISGKAFFEHFSIRRPEISTQDFISLQALCNQIVVIECSNPQQTTLRGQLEYLSDTDQLLFIGSPWFDSMEQVVNNHLKLNDFAFHDPMIDLLHVLKTQEITNNDLKQLLKTINEQKNELKKAANDINEIALFPMQNPDPLIRVDLKGKVMTLNPSADKLKTFNYQGRELSDKDFWKEITQQLDINGKRQTLEAQSGPNLYSFMVLPLPELKYYNIYGRDITSQKESERKVELLSLVARANANGVVFTDAQGVITWANEGYTKLTGFEQEEIIGRTPIEIGSGPLTDMEVIKTGMLEPFFAGKKFDVELVHYRKDGSWFWSRCSGQVIHDGDGKVSQYFTMIENITEEKETERKLREFDNRFRLVLEKIGDNVWEHDFRTGKTIFSNSNHSLLGVSIDSDTPVDQLWWSRVFKEDTPLLTQNDQKYKNGEIDHHILEYRLVHKDGSIKWVLDRGVVIEKDNNGRPLRIIGTHTDVTSQKHAELELLETKKKLESIFDEMTDVVWSRNWPESRLLFITPSAGKLFGRLPVGGAESRDWWEKFVHPEDKQVIKEIKTQLDEKGYFIKEYRVNTELGDTKWVNHSGRLIYNQENHPIRKDCIIRDITERKQAEETISQQIDLQNILIDISATYINIDLEKVEVAVQNSLKQLGEFVHADRAYVFDYDFTDQTTSNTFEWCAEGIAPEIDNLQKVPLAYFPQWVEKHAQGDPFYIPDVSELPEEGPESLRGILEAQQIKSLITLPMLRNDSLIGFVGFDSVRTQHEYSEKEMKLLFLFTQMLINVTERREWGMQLKRQEEKYRNIITNMNLGLIEIDSQEKIVFANQSFCQMSGFSLDELLGKRREEILPNHGPKTKIMSEPEDGTFPTFEVAVKNKQGAQRCWFVSEAPNFNDKGELMGTIGIHLDITDQKNLEKDLIEAKNHAEASTRAKELFLANMSHEIRTPMNAIMGMSNQLQKTTLSPNQKFYLNTIHSAADNLLIIINDILDLSKIEAGKLSLEHIGFEPKLIVGRAMHVMMHKAEEKGLIFTNSHCDSHLSPVLLGDPYRLNQILLNLISNAIKFTEKGSVDLSCRLVGQTDTHQKIRISVADTGIGMEESFKQNLFRKFNQEDSSITRRYGGTGLGMSIIKELVELMKGTIEVESTKGEGTTVSFTIELQRGSRADLPIKTNQKINTTILENKKILVVDDNEMNRLVAATLLTNYGAKIAEAGNGSGAVALLKQESFDLVLMDVQMPVMDGMEATRIIRESISTDIPIIALTAYAIKGDDTRFISSGMNDYLSKPFEENQFIQIVSKWLGNTIAPVLETAEALPDEKLFSLDKLSKIANGNQDFIDKMVALFIQQSQTSLHEIREAYAEFNFEAVRKIAHRLKPSIDTMEITSLREEIREIEKYDEKKESYESLNHKLIHLEKTIQEVVENLRTQ